MDNIKVKCYSGHTFAERPKAFTWQGVEYEVEKVEREWLEPGERHFQVRTGGSKLFKLCYNEAKDSWQITELISNTKTRKE